MANSSKKIDKPLCVSFSCPTTVDVGDPVRISDHLTVAGLTSDAHRDIVGVVVQHLDGADTCTVATPYTRRNEREAYAELTVGPFVWGTDNEVVGWTPGAFATVTGSNSGPFVISKANTTGTEEENYTIVAAAGGTTTTGDGPFTFELGISDAVKIKIGDAASQDFTLSGASQTPAQVVAQFAAAVGFTATVDGDTVVFQATDPADALEIEAVAADAYTVLGLTAQVNSPTSGNNKFKFSIDGGGSSTITLTAGTRTAAQVAAELNEGIGIVSSEADGFVYVGATLAGSILNILAVDDDCYTELGFTTGDYEATDTISLTVGSGDPQVLSIGSGSAVTASSVATAINNGITDITATLSGQKIVLTCDILGSDFSINAVDNDCYSILGFTPDTVEATDPSHSPAAIGGLVIGEPDVLSITGEISGPFEITNNSTDAFSVAIGGGASQIFDITAGEAITAEQIAEVLNATGSGFVASQTHDGKLKLTATQAWDNIEIETIANDAYDILGFSVGDNSASMVVQTLEY